MSTVPGPGAPAPANNAQTLLLQSDPGLYVRPTAGGNTSGAASGALGTAPGQPPAGNIMGNYSVPSPAPVSTGGTQTGPDMGHGATIVVSDSGSVESGLPDAQAVGGGTVGDSGNQGAPPVSTDMDYASDMANPNDG